MNRTTRESRIRLALPGDRKKHQFGEARQLPMIANLLSSAITLQSRGRAANSYAGELQRGNAKEENKCSNKNRRERGGSNHGF